MLACRAVPLVISESPLFQLTLMRFRMFFREPSAVFWSFGFPLVLSFVLGLAFRSRPADPVYAAVEQGEGAAALVKSLTARPGVHVELLDAGAARAALRSGKVALVIVPGATRTYRFDPARPDSRLARLVVDDLLQRADGRQDPTRVTDAHFSEPGGRYIDFLIPGLIGMNIMSSGMWGVGYVIVELRTRKLLKRMVATPMKRWHFLVSFILLRMAFLVLELPLLLGFARFVFGVTVHGPLFLVALLAALGSFAFAGIGILVASRTENTQTVGGLINLVTLPMFMGSGVFFSNARFPDAMQPVIRALPLTTLIDALRAVMNEGAGVSRAALPALLLTLWGTVTTLVALYRFRWQ
jgi:ABC-type multidrug transport system permease subunit